MFFMHSIFVFPNGEAIIQNLSAENIRSQRKAIKNHFFCNIVAVSIFSINVILLHSMTQLSFLFYFPCDFEVLLGLQVSRTGGSISSCSHEQQRGLLSPLLHQKYPFCLKSLISKNSLEYIVSLLWVILFFYVQILNISVGLSILYEVPS